MILSYVFGRFDVHRLQIFSRAKGRLALSKPTTVIGSLMTGMLVCCLLIAFSIASSFAIISGAKETYDVVVLNGRVMDPESRLDAVRNIGISRGSIKIITKNQLNGRTVIDAKGLVVAPGFIDLHQHGQNEENYRFKAMDGVTTAMELEVGTGDVDRWYAARDGKTLINYGVSIGHLASRMAVMNDPITFLPSGEAARRAATETEIAGMKRIIEHGLRRGAVAVGFGIQYVPKASHWEILGDVSCRRPFWRVVPRPHAKRRIERTCEQHSST